jgi:hypothetical protein
MRYGIWILACLCLNSGCSVRGFSNVPDGPTSPTQLRAAAATARAEASALEAIADQQEGVIRQVLGAAQSAAESLGAPAVLTGLIGAAGGFLVPTPGQKRREKVAKAEGAVESTARP